MIKRIKKISSNLSVVERIIIVILFILILFIATYVFLNINENKTYIIENNERAIRLNELYEENGVLFTNKLFKFNDQEHNYIQLSGLKNAKVENNINKDILNKVKSLAKDISSDDKISVVVYGNFSNVLSVVFIKKTDVEEYIIDTLNYNLVDGSILQVGDFFLKDTIALDIISEILDKNKNLHIENGQDILDNKYKFYFDQANLYIIDDTEILEINFYDYYEQIGIYDKYITNVSIYENNFYSNDIVPASYRTNGIYSKIDFSNENLFIDTVIYSSIDNVDEKIILGVEDCMEKLYANVGVEDSYSFLNQSGSLVKLSDTYIDKSSELEIVKDRYNLYQLNIISNIYNVSEKYFKENMVETIYDLHRIKPNNVDNIIKFTKYNSLETDKLTLIILANGELLTTIDDLFVEGFTYKDEIKSIIKHTYSISSQELDELLKNAKYDFILENKNIDNAYSIVVTLSNGKKVYVSFDKFDKNIMNIY